MCGTGGSLVESMALHSIEALQPILLVMFQIIWSIVNQRIHIAGTTKKKS